MNNLLEIKQSTIKSTELVDIINEFRKEEGNYTVLQHKSFMDKIRKELETMKKLNLNGEQNFLPTSYTDTQNKTQPCFQLNRDGMLQMLNSESTYVRFKTIEYINKLEETIKEGQAPKKQLTAMEQLRLQYEVLDEHEKRIEGVAKKVDDLQANMPLFNVECKELQALVRKVGTKVLGGYQSAAYKDNSLRGKIYSDIQHQLRREFGIERYEAIKRSQLDTAKKIVSAYKAPTVLLTEISLANSQITFEDGVV